jgi:hypothetical protein
MEAEWKWDGSGMEVEWKWNGRDGGGMEVGVGWKVRGICSYSFKLHEGNRGL